MTIVDILLLEILRKSNALKIKELYNKLSSLEISCCTTSIYRRLNRLRQKKLITIKWSEGSKFYSISQSGKDWVNIFKSKLQ